MTVYLTLDTVQELQRRIVDATGGSHGIRDVNAVDSAVAQPQQTSFGEDLQPTRVEKAAAPGFSRIRNHRFIEGNERIGDAAMHAFVHLNGYAQSGSVDKKELTVLAVAATMERTVNVNWVKAHLVELSGDGAPGRSS